MDRIPHQDQVLNEYKRGLKKEKKVFGDRLERVRKNFWSWGRKWKIGVWIMWGKDMKYSIVVKFNEI